MPKKRKTRGYGWIHVKGLYRKFNNDSAIRRSSKNNAFQEDPALKNVETDEVEEMPPIKKFLCSLCGVGFSEEKCLRNHFQICQNTKNPVEKYGADAGMVKLEVGEAVLKKLEVVTEPKLVIKSEELEITETTIFSTIPLKGETTWQPIPHADQMEAYNETERQHRCNTCDFSTTKSIFLNAHKKLQHQRRPYVRNPRGVIVKCIICNRAFKTPYTLTVHMRQHTGERPFKCAICNYASTQRGNLVLHIRTHTGQKPFQCTVCNYACTQSSALKLHMRKHTGLKPFKCTLCNYASAYRSALKTHATKHT